jgi:hypothetical protein
MRPLILFFAACCFQVSCSAPPTSHDAAFSASWFALHNLTSTGQADHFLYDEKGYYTDSTRKVPFTALDSFQKMTYLMPVLECDSEYLKQFMPAHFISIQEKVKGFTPIIVELSGDDYWALHYVLLDEKHLPVSDLLVHGGFCSGPAGETDSTYTECPIRHSFFRGDQVDSYELHVTHSTSRIPKPDIVDSISFRSVILENGTIRTQRTDSVRYVRAMTDARS